MFNRLMNLFRRGNIGDEYFYENPNAQPLTAEQQFSISLGQVIGEQNNYFVNSLLAAEDRDSHKKSLKKWWGIDDKASAHEILASRSREGHRALFNELVDLFLQYDGDTDKLDKNGADYEVLVEYFDKVNDVLDTEEGQEWFPNIYTDFQVKCNAWDVGRMVFVARTCYTLGYITEAEAWQYINYVTEIAKQSFNGWRNYAKSYLLGRAFWGGNNYDDFGSFANVVEMLVEDEDSPWVIHGWLKK